MLGASLAVVAGTRSDDVGVDFLGPPGFVSGFGLGWGVSVSGGGVEGGRAGGSGDGGGVERAEVRGNDQTYRNAPGRDWISVSLAFAPSAAMGMIDYAV